jgi:hypothetical protein
MSRDCVNNMGSPETTTVFAGIDGRADATLPAWYEERHSGTEVVSFAEAIRDLPRAVESEVAFRNPYSGEWVDTERFNAIVEPERLAAQASGEAVDALFHIPTDSYAIINPMDVYAPLETVLQDETLDGRALGNVLFVEILRLCREAGMAEMGEVALDGRRVQGDAALDQNRTREQITDEIQDILDEAAEIDEAEDDEYGPEQRGDELPEELREQEDRLNRLQEAKNRLDTEEQQLKAEQVEKIHQREREEEEMGQKKRGRKPTPPEEVELPDDEGEHDRSSESDAQNQQWVEAGLQRPSNETVAVRPGGGQP